MFRWLAFALAAALGLALATQTGAKGYNATLAAIVLMAGGLVVVAFQIQRPFLGIAALMFTSVALPMNVAAGGKVNAPVGLAVLICFCWIVRELFFMRRLHLTASPAVGTLIALMSSAVASFFAGRIDWYSVPGAPTGAQVGGLAMFLLSGGLLLAVAHQLRSVDELKKLTYLFLAAGSVVPFLMLSPKFDIIAGPTVHPFTIGSVFWTWLVGMGAAHVWFNRELSSGARFGLLVVVLTALFHGIVQQQDWASGWVPPVIAFGIVSALKFPRTVICACAVASPAAFFVVQKVVSKLMAHESYSLMTRVDAWQTVWHIIEKSPIFGVGPSNYYHFAQLYSTSGWYVKLSSHNNYIDIAAQTGFVGLFLFLCFSLAALSLILRLKMNATGAFEHAYAVGCLGSVVASLGAGMLGDWIIPFVYNIGFPGFRSSLLFWVFIGGALALWRMRGQEEAVAPETQSFYQLPSPLLLEGGFGPLELEPPH